MGRLIDADRLQKQFDEKSTNPNYRVNIHNIKSIICNAPTIEAIPKADYENRLKADLETILVELQLEIEEKEQHYQDKFLEPNNAVHEAAMGGRMFGCGECKEVIQQKINSLKGEENVDTDTKQTETH